MSLFGGMPFPVQFFLAFVIVLGLIGATAWAVRRFGAGPIGGAGMRGRQPRLAVVDYASVDGRRRLLLVRRDNVEHLVMIGGPTDVVVESNIVRAARRRATSRSRRPGAGGETMPHAIPLPDHAATARGRSSPNPQRQASAPRLPRSEPLPPEAAPWPLQPHAEAPACARPPRHACSARRRTVDPAGRAAAQPPASQRASVSAGAAARTPGKIRAGSRQEPYIPVAQPLPRRPPQRPIKASPKWRIGSKRRLRKPNAQAPKRRARRGPRRCRARRCRPNSRDSRAARPRPLRPPPPAASSPARRRGKAAARRCQTARRRQDALRQSRTGNGEPPRPSTGSQALMQSN